MYGLLGTANGTIRLPFGLEKMAQKPYTSPLGIKTPPPMPDLPQQEMPVNQGDDVNAQYGPMNTVDPRPQEQAPMMSLSRDGKVFDYGQKKLEKYFGHTKNIAEAGYITPEGNMLDFSGRNHGNINPRGRGFDHREVNQVLDFEKNKELKKLSDKNPGSNSTGMNYLVNKGNIRVKENGISLGVKPTEVQLSIARNQIKNSSGESYAVDITDSDGNVIKSLSYEFPNVNAAKIIADINNQFDKLSTHSAEERLKGRLKH